MASYAQGFQRMPDESDDAFAERVAAAIAAAAMDPDDPFAGEEPY